MLSSRENPIIKQFRSLAASAKERREQGLVLIEGLRLCCDAAGAGAEVRQLLLTADAMERWAPQLAPLLAAAGYTALVSPALGEYLAETKNSQGVYCLCTMPQVKLPDFSAGGRYLLLDRLQDPGNLGTILRGAEAFGITTVVLSSDCADLWSPKVLRSAMGSSFRQSVVVVESLCTVIDSLQAAEVPVYAAALDAGAVPAAHMTPGPGGIGVVVGNEGAGISPQVLARCGRRVYIPMTSAIESLNAATAAGVLLWELCGRGEALQ